MTGGVIPLRISRTLIGVISDALYIRLQAWRTLGRALVEDPAFALRQEDRAAVGPRRASTPTRHHRTVA